MTYRYAGISNCVFSAPKKFHYMFEYLCIFKITCNVNLFGFYNLFIVVFSLNRMVVILFVFPRLNISHVLVIIKYRKNIQIITRLNLSILWTYIFKLWWVIHMLATFFIRITISAILLSIFGRVKFA